MSMKMILLYCILLTSSLSFPSLNYPTRYASSLQSIPTNLDVVTSGLSSIFRLLGGTNVNKVPSIWSAGDSPKLKVLYDIENSSSCRKVREKITEANLNVELVIPATKGSRAFDDTTYEYYIASGTELPVMILEDTNGDELILSGADDCVSYLDERLGNDPFSNENPAITLVKEVGAYAASLIRLGRGSYLSSAAVKAPRPQKPLILYNYEGNQFCRLVREVLTELDLVYELRSTGKGSPRREELKRVSGKTQCPYLIDPNTETQMGESKDIIQYLYKTYAKWTPPNEILQFASEYVLPWVRPIFQTLAPLQAGSSKSTEYKQKIQSAAVEIKKKISNAPVVMYTYELSPFCTAAKDLLRSLDIEFTEVSLGREWIPGLIQEDGSVTRAALLDMTGQSSLPHVFIGEKSVGGLFSGTPGLIPALEQGALQDMVRDAQVAMKERAKKKMDSKSPMAAGIFGVLSSGMFE